MTLKKAIEILQDILKFVKPGDPPDEHDAIKLGVEALKQIQRYRKSSGIPYVGLLPGETED